MQTRHVSVMLEEVLKFLQPQPGGHYVDGTIGGGGHSEAILERSAPDGKVLGIDIDVQALRRVGERLSDSVNNGRLVLVHGNFEELARIVDEAGFVSIQGVLLDLGFSSHQMDDPQRGFSFSADGPLDMRLNQSQEVSAADVVNNASEQELADIFWRYGEENRARQIARRIIRERGRVAITRTRQLAELAAAGVPYKPGVIHPATRVFQALRIAVNHELEHLETVLPQILNVLTTGSTKTAGFSGAVAPEGGLGSPQVPRSGESSSTKAAGFLGAVAPEQSSGSPQVPRSGESSATKTAGFSGAAAPEGGLGSPQDPYSPWSGGPGSTHQKVPEREEGGREQGGRMVIITFHSLEDRLVKEFMRREATDCLCPPRIPVCVCGHKARLRLLTPKPVTPTTQEVSANPRARSAKLRAAEIVVGS